jgi:regulator of sigma E protease
MFSYYGFGSTKLGPIPAGTQLAATEAKAGDEIVGFNGRQIFTDLDLTFFSSNASKSDSVPLSLKSAKTGNVYQVTLNPEFSYFYRIGIYVLSEYSKEGGMVVEEVEKDQNGGNPVLLKGDIVMALNGISVQDPTYADIRDKDAKTITLAVIRDGKTMDITMKADIQKRPNELGFTPTRGSGFRSLIKESVLYSVSVIHISIETLKDMVSGDVKVTDVVSGPVGIASLVSNVVDAPQATDEVKVYNLGLMAALISVGLAFSNMLPLPGLDGNSIVMVTVELIRGRKISVKTERVINVIGFAVLIMLVFLALYSDISRLVG